MNDCDYICIFLIENTNFSGQRKKKIKEERANFIFLLTKSVNQWSAKRTQYKRKNFLATNRTHPPYPSSEKHPNHVFQMKAQFEVICGFLQLTGRVEEKRRWTEGIHQAVEAKEGLKIQVYFNV